MKFRTTQRGQAPPGSGNIKVPGPANYNLQDYNKKRGPSFSAGVRRATSYETANPGPGAYDPNANPTK